MNQDISATLMDEETEVQAEISIVPAAEERVQVTSGYELAKAIDANPEEGVLIAVFPEIIEEITTKEIPYLDVKGDHMHVALMHSSAWGQRAMDVVSPNEQAIKWWRVKAMIEQENLDIIPIRWQGPIGEIPSKYFEQDYVLAVRFYQHGPWFFPKEQPQLKTDTVEETKSEMDEAGPSAG